MESEIKSDIPEIRIRSETQSEQENNKNTHKIAENKSDSEVRSDLHREDLLEEMTREYDKEIIGEHENIQLAICCLVSRYLPKKYRTSAIVVNPTGTGKSHFVNNMLKPLSEDPKVVWITNGSDSFYKRTLGNLNGFVIFIEQLEQKDKDGNITLGFFKPLLTEGKVKFGNAEYNKESKSWETKEFNIYGKPILFSTSSKTSIDQETANRFLWIELNETREQTEKICSHILKLYSGNRCPKTDFVRLLSIYNNLEKSGAYVEEVIIPFANKIKLPDDITLRRDLSKILNLTAHIAFIHYKNRDKVSINQPEHMLTSSFGESEDIHKAIIIAKPEDYYHAVRIARSITSTINKTNAKAQTVFEFLKDDKIPRSQTEVMQSLGLSKTTSWELLKQLSDNGLVECDKSAKPFKFSAFPDASLHKLNNENIEFSDKELEEFIKENYPGDTYTFVRTGEQQPQNPKSTHKVT